MAPTFDQSQTRCLPTTCENYGNRQQHSSAVGRKCDGRRKRSRRRLSMTARPQAVLPLSACVLILQYTVTGGAKTAIKCGPLARIKASAERANPIMRRTVCLEFFSARICNVLWGKHEYNWLGVHHPLQQPEQRDKHDFK